MTLNSDAIVQKEHIGAFATAGNPEIINRRPSLVREQGFHQTNLDHTLMSNIHNDITAMHSTDPELFESVASKFDETFGANALV